MQGTAIPLPNGIAKLISRKELELCPAWRTAFERRCKDHRYYEILEQTLDSGFEHHYLLLEDLSGKVRAIQPIFFVRQNLIECGPGRIRRAVDVVRKKFPGFLTMRVVMVGCAAGEGHLGACSATDETWVADALHASLSTIARQNKASLVVLKD